MIIFRHLKNFFLKTNLSQFIKEISKYLLLRCIAKILNGLFPDIMQEIFETKIKYYNTHNAPAFSSRNIKTVRYGLQTISYMAPKIWDLVPKEMKQVTTLKEFKAKIKIWKLENCPCRLCRTYLLQIGFIT